MKAGRALRHLVSWQLDSGPNDPIDISGTTGIASVAEYHQVTGVVLSALAAGAATGQTDELADDLGGRHRLLVHRSLAAEADLVLVARRFRDRAIPFRVLKGCATAHLDHTDPALRLTSDVDVLVPGDQLAAATRAVADLVDVDRTVPDRRAAWTERFGKDRTLALRTGGWLDLHRMPAAGYHGLADDHDWFGGSDPFEVGGVEVSGLAPEDRFVHALAHAAYSTDVRLHSIRDIPVIAASLESDWVTIVERHPRWAGLLARGAEVVWGNLDLERHRLLDWAESVRPSRRERLALQTFDLTGARQHWGGVLAVPPWRWPGLIVPIAVPSREYLAHRGRTRSDHLRRNAARIRPISATSQRVASDD